MDSEGSFFSPKKHVWLAHKVSHIQLMLVVAAFLFTTALATDKNKKSAKKNLLHTRMC
jgi:hypothetical protein